MTTSQPKPLTDEQILSSKIAPVQGFTPGIPWEMHLRAYDVYCREHGPQPALIDLERRNCRGGFSASELDHFIPGWRAELSSFRKMEAAWKLARAHAEALQSDNARLREALIPHAYAQGNDDQGWYRRCDLCDAESRSPHRADVVHAPTCPLQPQPVKP